PVVHDHLLPERLRELLAHEARDHVGAAAGREGDDDANGPGGILLRVGGWRNTTREDDKRQPYRRRSPFLVPRFSPELTSNRARATSNEQRATSFIARCSSPVCTARP